MNNTEVWLYQNFFLSEVPQWLNFSESGKCTREHNLKFFNYKKLRQNFELNYPKAVHFQNLYNVIYRENLKKTKNSYLPLKEEEKIFFEALEKVKADQSLFQSPTYSIINLFWVDYLMNSRDKKKVSKLKGFYLQERAAGVTPFL